MESFRYSCVEHGGQDGRAISQVPHLVYVMPFLFDANVISVGRNEKVVMQGNYRGHWRQVALQRWLLRIFNSSFLPDLDIIGKSTLRHWVLKEC